jgi:hypothetical protein
MKDIHTKMLDGMTSKRTKRRTSLSFLSLPTRVHGIVFDRLAFCDAIHLALACKELRAVGKGHLERQIACAACLTPLCSASAAHEAERGRLALPFSLDDGPSMCLGEESTLGDFKTNIKTNIHLSEEEDLQSPVVRRHLSAGCGFAPNAFKVRVRPVLCKCGLYLGIQVVEVNGYREDDDLDFAFWRFGLILGHIFCALPYLTVVRLPHGVEEGVEDLSLPGLHWKDRVSKVLYRCGSDQGLCKAPLFYDQAILSKDHSWKPTDEASTFSVEVPAEEAWYINQVLEGGVEPWGPCWDEELSQGIMTLVRARCKSCKRELGWKFIACKENGKNLHSCGRWGILAGRVYETPLLVDVGKLEGETLETAPPRRFDEFRKGQTPTFSRDT